MEFQVRQQWLSFITDLVGGLAWPIVTLVAILVVAPKLSSLLSRVTEIKYGDAQINLREDVEDLRQLAESYGVTLDYPNVSASAVGNAREFILLSWNDIENTILRIFNLSSQKEKLMLNVNSRNMIDRLVMASVIDARLGDLLNHLRTVSNRAEHAPDFNLSESERRELAGMITSVKHRLRDALRRTQESLQ